MVDRTVYAADAVPELPLRQILGRQKIPEDLCKLVADSGLRSVETFAMLGDTIAMVKQTIKTLIPDHTQLGADQPAQELALTSLAAVWKTCSTMQDHFAARRAKMEEDPSKVPEIPGEDHAEFRETFVSRHPLTLFFQSIVSLTASSLRESKIILSMVLFTSTRWVRSGHATSRSLRSPGSPRMRKICCAW